MLVWVDCEMTGLDTVNDTIIEICVLITNDKLQIIEPNGFERVIHVPESRLQQMTEWPRNQHKKSGLWQKVVASTNTREQVAKDLFDYIKQHVPKGEALLAGNSVYMDKIYLMREYPEFTDYLHYRIIDVSSFKEMCKRVNPELLTKLPAKTMQHTARADIVESIEEMRFYIENFCVTGIENK